MEFGIQHRRGLMSVYQESIPYGESIYVRIISIDINSLREKLFFAETHYHYNSNSITKNSSLGAKPDSHYYQLLESTPKKTER